MASFGGHAIPGGFFFLLGLWLTVRCVLNHYWRRNKARGRLTVPPFFKKMNYVEGGLAAFASFVGELSSPTIPSPRLPCPPSVTALLPPQV